MSTVALETGEDRFVDEAGRFAGTLEPIISGEDGDITFSRTNGIIASSSLPGLFPPLRLNGRSWIDGGVRRGVPIGAAIDAGAKKVIAISTAPTKILPVERMLQPVDNAGVLIEDYSHAGIIDIAMRSLMTMVDAMHWVELNPETEWPVPVQIIQPTFRTKGGEAIDPALISINYAYGWMRAFDILMAAPEQREAAMASTDRIINLRCAARTAEMKFREQYLIATMGDFIVDAEHRSPALLHAAQQAARLSQTWLGQSRNYKWELRNELVSRQDAGFLVDPESPGWLAKFEKFVPEQWGSGWERLLRIPESPFEEITITVTTNRTVGGSVGSALPPTFAG